MHSSGAFSDVPVDKILLEVRGGNCEPLLIPLSRPRERAGEREKYRRRFARARLYGTHVPLAILVLYRVGSVSA